MLITAIFAAGWLMAQGAAVTATPPAPAATTPASAKVEKPKKPRMICTDEAVVGSIISKRVCRTPEQDEAARATATRATDRLLDRLATCSAASC